jgi:alpha-methylacyl-CoA racemase
MLPLAGIRVLDFSTLLPGPMAGLFLVEAGAEVIKIERPGTGDEMRTYSPRLGEDSANFALLNRGKRSIAIDLKAPGAVAQLTPLIERSDVLIEQFRPGVMERLGLGYAALSKINPRLVYCSITGFGQTGPRRDMAAHDLNYLALAGLLSLTGDREGAPGMPQIPIADIAAGTYPALINVLLALLQRHRTGQGCHLDVSMTDNLFVLAYWGLANGFAAGAWPTAGSALTTGASPRYQIYRTADGGYLSAGPIE